VERSQRGRPVTGPGFCGFRYCWLFVCWIFASIGYGVCAGDSSELMIFMLNAVRQAVPATATMRETAMRQAPVEPLVRSPYAPAGTRSRSQAGRLRAKLKTDEGMSRALRQAEVPQDTGEPNLNQSEGKGHQRRPVRAEHVVEGGQQTRSR